MSADKFLLHKEFSGPLDFKGFKAAQRKYLQLVDDNAYSPTRTKNIYELIQEIKRAPKEIGPYVKISVFEALNRIGSDLVLLSGSEQLFERKVQGIIPRTIHLKMGNTRGFDFEVTLQDGTVIYGEAFNAAESFCKEKMRQAIEKVIKKNEDPRARKAIIMVNDDVREIIEDYNNKLEKANQSQFEILKVYCKVL